MSELVVSDGKVKAVFAEERLSQAETEFAEDDWQKQLDIDKSGTVKNTLAILQ